MQTVSAALREALRNGDALDAQPRLIAEWNQNRFAGIQQVDNDPADPSGYLVGEEEDKYPYNFPIMSIVAANRPTRGVIKARASTEISTQTYWSPNTNISGEEGYTSADYSDTPTYGRYYTVGPDAPYKYWTSPQPSLVSGSFPVGAEVRPYVIYKKLAWTNKIVVGFENTWANPNSYTIEVTTQDGNSGWTPVASNIVPDENGQVTIYRQSSGVWSTTVYRDAPMQIRGIRLVVNSINKPYAHLNLIELSARLESDLTDHVISYDYDFDMSEPNFITPLGQASSNTGNVKLSNIIGTDNAANGLFNKDNPTSIYYGMIDHNVKMTMEIGYLIGGTREYVREFEMLTEDWSPDGEDTIDVGLKDHSKFMQEEDAPKLFLENVTVGEAIWRICDVVGFSKYEYDKRDADAATIIPYFWSDGSNTIWGLFQQLAEATQTAIFFDEFGYLRIQTRDAAYNPDNPVTWALTAVDQAGTDADIISLRKSADFEANTVNITYQTTKTSDYQHGFPKMDVVWQPEGDYVLRAANLVENMNSTQTTIRMTSEDATMWPYEGFMTIEGEIIQYKGKEYQYYNKSGNVTTVRIDSLDEKNNIDRNLSDTTKYNRNSFTGRFYIEKRGAWGTYPADHSITSLPFVGQRHQIGNIANEPYAGAYQHNRMASLVRVTTPGNWSPDMYYTLTQGSYAGPSYKRYGTSIRIPKAGQVRGTQGMVINFGNGGTGYYIELIRSTILNDQNGAGRNAHHELNVGVRRTNGTFVRVGPNSGKGVQMTIAEDTWYDLDAIINTSGTTDTLIVSVNGKQMLTAQFTGTNRMSPTGAFGVFGRGPGSVGEYDYIYGYNNTELEPNDESTILDKVRGNYISTQWERQIYSNMTGMWGQKNQTAAKTQNYLYSEFGPIIHEVREMSVSFEKSPVIHARLYATNDYQSVCPAFRSDNFGAYFILANRGRENAVLNGTDELTFGSDAAAEQHLMIYGRVVYQEEEETHTVKDIDGVARRGVVSVDVNNKWIQSKAAAEALGAWIVKHWSEGNDELGVEVFGNPLFQLGDLVTVHSPEQDIYQDTHRYFIVGIRNEFQEGLSTSLTLRRAKI